MKCLLKYTLLILNGWLVVSCSISYKFNQSSIDYTKVASISIHDFSNMAQWVNASLAQNFTEALRDKYTRQTKLRVELEGGDMDIEGEITGYTLTPLAVSENTYSSQSRLTITIRVRFTNNKDPDNDFERTFSAKSEFDESNSIDEVQDELCDVIIKEIIDQIFNATVATW